MQDEAIIYVKSLKKAREEILQLTGKTITLTNLPGSINYLGIKLIDHIFNILKTEFNIHNIIINVEDNNAAAISALKLGYKNIKYYGDSSVIKKLLGLEL